MEKVDICFSAVQKVDVCNNTSAIIESKYIKYNDLKEGYYRVKSFAFIRINNRGNRRIRVDLDNNTFIITPKDYVQATDGLSFYHCSMIGREHEYKYSPTWSKHEHMILHFWKDDKEKIGIYFFTCDQNFEFNYSESKLKYLDDLYFHPLYHVAVLLFSIENFKGKDRIRVDLDKSIHFILPENEEQHDIQELSENHNKNKKKNQNSRSRILESSKNVCRFFYYRIHIFRMV